MTPHRPTILVTRPKEAATPLMLELSQRGYVPLLYPGLAFAPPADVAPLDSALKAAAAGCYAAVILTSPQAARVIGERLVRLDLHWEQQTVWTIGRYTAAACLFKADIKTPDTAHDTRTLLDSLPDLRGKRVLLAQSPLAAPTLYEGLITRGAQVMMVEPYQVVDGEGGESVPNLLRQGHIDALTFFSGSAVEGVLARLEAVGLSLTAVQRIPSVCFGASAARVVRHMGGVVWEGDATYDTFYALLAHACQNGLHGLYP